MYTANIQTMCTQNNNVAVSLHFLIFGIPGYDLLGPLTIIKRFVKQMTRQMQQHNLILGATMVLMTTTKTIIVAYVDGHSSTDVNSGIFSHLHTCTGTVYKFLLLY